MVGCKNKCDEWRLEDIVDIHEEEASDSSSDERHEGDFDDPQSLNRTQFCLYDELDSRIKSLLLCGRKADPVCRISMTFDTIYFDGLIRRSKPVPRSRRSKCQLYTVPNLSRLDDILGHRWYIRGINTAGDFCFVTPGNVSSEAQYRQNRLPDASRWTP